MTYDMAILGPPGGIGNPALLDFDGTVAEGVYKLAQKCLLILFMDKQDPNNNGKGTNIQDITGGANASAMDTIQNLFSIAASDIADTFVALTDTSEMSDDEILDRVAFDAQAVEGSPSQVNVTMTVYAVSGENTVVSIPIKYEEAVNG